MSKELLEIKDLHVNAGEKEILKGLNLKINKGEVHVIMGPNGAGKSTLANVILNNPEYTKTSGTVEFEGGLCLPSCNFFWYRPVCGLYHCDQFSEGFSSRRCKYQGRSDVGLHQGKRQELGQSGRSCRFHHQDSEERSWRWLWFDLWYGTCRLYAV